MAITPVVGTKNADTIQTSNKNEHISGSVGDDSIGAADGHDQAYGGGGNDVIAGDRGNDTLVGGGGPTYVELSELETAESATAQVTFVRETAGFQNSLGVYKIAKDGTISDARILYDNTSQRSEGVLYRGDETVDVPVNPGERLGFFLVPDGWRENGSNSPVFGAGTLEFRNAQGGAANINTDVDPVLVHMAQDGTETLVKSEYGNTIWHSAASVDDGYRVNADNTMHSVTELLDDGTISLRFEDLRNGGDKDYTDIIFNVDLGSAANRAVANPGAPSSQSDDDTIDGGVGNDNIFGMAGHDSLLGGEGTDWVKGNSGNDTMHGGSGQDTLNGGKGDDIITGDGAADLIDGASGHDRISGGDDADTIRGSNGNDTIDGNFGDDVIYGGKGDDSIEGSGGADAITGHSGNDVAHGGSGNDTVRGEAGDDRLDGGAGEDRLNGGSGNDTLNGGEDADDLWGKSGNDVLNGEGGNDLIDGAKGNDVIDGGDGDDRIRAGSGHDEADGGTGDDIVTGWFGNDAIDGGNGDDILFGGAGSDTLTGGNGEDRFAFRTGDRDGTTDTVTDFELGTDHDRLDLRQLNLGYADADALVAAAGTVNGSTMTLALTDLTIVVEADQSFDGADLTGIFLV